MARRNENQLTDKWQIFCDAYLNDPELNATRAYKAAYARCSQRTAEVEASKLLHKPEIKAYIARMMEARSAQANLDADKMLDLLTELARADLADLFDEHNALKPVRDWPAIWKSGLVSSLDTTDLFETRTDEEGNKVKVKVGVVNKIRLCDRVKILDMIGRHVDVQAWRERNQIDSPVAPHLQPSMQTSNWDAIRAAIKKQRD